MSYTAATPLAGTTHLDPFQAAHRIDAHGVSARAFNVHAAGHGNASVNEAGQVQFSTVKDPVELYALKADWDELFAHAGHGGQVFQTHGWCRTWAATFLKPGQNNSDELFVVTGRVDGRLVMVWPLVRERSHGMSRLVWLGAPVTQYGDCLLSQDVDKDAVLDSAWAFISQAANVDYVLLGKVREDATVAPLMARIGAVATVVESAPHLDLSTAQSYADYAGKFSRKSLKTRARKFRKLEQMGDVTLDRLSGGPEAQQVVSEALALKRDWLRQTGRVSKAIMCPDTEMFFLNATSLEAADEMGTLVTALRLDGELLAAEICFVCKGHLVVHVLVYALSYEKFSAGQLLMERSIEACFDLGVTRFDLMAPGDAYKFAWSDDTLAVTDWAVPMGLRGRVWVRGYLGFARERLKQMQARMPLGLRRKLAALHARLSGGA